METIDVYLLQRTSHLTDVRLQGRVAYSQNKFFQFTGGSTSRKINAIKELEMKNLVKKNEHLLFLYYTITSLKLILVSAIKKLTRL